MDRDDPRSPPEFAHRGAGPGWQLDHTRSGWGSASQWCTRNRTGVWHTGRWLGADKRETSTPGGPQYGGPHSPPPAANSPPPSPSSSAITRSRGQDLAAARLVVSLVQSRAISVNLGRTWLPHGSSISCNLGQSRQDLAAARLVNIVQSRSISAGPGCRTARRLPAPREARPRCTSLRIPYLQSLESSVPHTS